MNPNPASPFATPFLTFALGLALLLGNGSAWAASVLPVTVSTLEESVIYPTRSAPANVISANDSRLSADISAVVERIPREVGETVAKGTPLVELAQYDLKLSIRAAQASLESLRAQHQLAKEQYQRVKKLAKKRSVTEELVGQRRTDVKVGAADVLRQEIKLEELNRNLDKTIVRAPFAAIVVEHLAHVGELAGPGTPLIRVVDTSRIEVSAQIQSYDVASLIRATQINLITQFGTHAVQVHRVVPVIDELERSQEVRLSFKTEAALIGSNGRLEWRDPSPHLPADLLVRRGKRLGIFVVEDDFAHFVSFPAAEEGRPALNQLPPESTLIIDGRFVLQEGQPVRIKQQPQADRGNKVSDETQQGQAAQAATSP